MKKPKREIPFGEVKDVGGGSREGRKQEEKLIDLLDGHLPHITCVLLYQYPKMI
jgi:hypothetical protein